MVFAVLALCLAFPALAAPTFPPLTGRVVDTANLFTPEQKAALEAKLLTVEQTTGHQLVVATIADMQGYPLSDYGYQLGRAWGIGKKGNNDGAILFAAPNEPAGSRGPRLEVGYGLEPQLTDAFSSVVTYGLMTPKLRAGDVYGAFDAGIDSIAAQIKLTPEEAAKRTAQLTAESTKRAHSVNPSAIIFWIVIFLFFILPLVRRMGGGRSYGGGGGIGNIILWSALNGLANGGRGGGSDDDWSGGGGGWGGGGGSDGGGFSGGGGSFGGGGASGGW